MPRLNFDRYDIEIRTNEHNHKGQRAHVHVYIYGREVGAFYLDGELMVGDVRGRDRRKIREIILKNANRFQAMWDEYQKSVY